MIVDSWWSVLRRETSCTPCLSWVSIHLCCHAPSAFLQATLAGGAHPLLVLELSSGLEGRQLIHVCVLTATALCWHNQADEGPCVTILKTLLLENPESRTNGLQTRMSSSLHPKEQAVQTRDSVKERRSSMVKWLWMLVGYQNTSRRMGYT